MKQINIFAVSIVLTCFALLPAVAIADGLDDLEVTMDVLDTESELDEVIAEMRGPEDGDSESDRNDEEDEVGEVGGDGEADGDVAAAGDGFERDVVREEDEMADESNFEEGEEVDEDIFDEIDDPMDEPMDEEMSADETGDEGGDDAI